jgi:hypothetical protein
MDRKLTLLWQERNSGYAEWIREIFSPVIDGEIVDGEHQIVLDNCLIVDTHLHRVDPSYYAKFRGRNAFLLRLSDEYFRDVSDVYANFIGVFRMHYSAAFREDRVMCIPVGYQRGLGRSSLGREEKIKPASQRRYAWSMLGQINKATRPDAVEALIPVEPGFWYASDGWTPGAATSGGSVSKGKPQGDYRKMLAETAFSPAPMGNVQQETYRVYEILEAGSIPLLERQWFMDAHRHLLGPHPLPTFGSWKKAASFVETMWANPAGLDQLQAECMDWWSRYKVELTGRVQAMIDRLWDAPPAGASEFVKGYARLPGWQLWELARHHSAAALRRRILRHLRRFKEHGKLTERI